MSTLMLMWWFNVRLGQVVCDMTRSELMQALSCSLFLLLFSKVSCADTAEMV